MEEPEDPAVDWSYQGETSRTLFTRAHQHMSDYCTHVDGSRPQPRSSWMWDHVVEVHQGVISQDPHKDFNFQLMGSFTDPLSRQLDESVRIGMVNSHGKVLGDRWPGRVVLLNRKDEHYQPRLVLPSFETLGNMLQG